MVWLDFLLLNFINQWNETYRWWNRVCMVWNWRERACKHLTLSSHWNPDTQCARVCVCSCQHDKEMRGDRHNSCIMIVTSEPYLSDFWFIYALIWCCVGDVFLLTEICFAWGNADGWKTNIQRLNSWTWDNVLGSWTMWKQSAAYHPREAGLCFCCESLRLYGPKTREESYFLNISCKLDFFLWFVYCGLVNMKD